MTVATPALQENEQLHMSFLLQQLIAEAPRDSFTLGWLVTKLPKHSFGFILLFLALIALLPVISIVAQILMIILTGQIILGYPSPVLPQRYMTRPLPTKYLVRLERHVVPALRQLESLVRPRWPIMLIHTRRPVAFLAMMMSVFSLLVPLPLINVPPAIIAALIALSYIEHDGFMLFIALASVFLFGTLFFLKVA